MLVLYNTRRLSNNPAEKSFGWVRAAVDCDGLAYESARQAQRSRARTANKTVGLKDRRKKVSDGWQSGRLRRS